MYFGYLVDVFWLSCLCILAILLMYFGYLVYVFWLSRLCILAILNEIAKIHQQDSQNTSTR
jgi:hypothetical protein